MEREQEILQELAYGLRNDEIAHKLIISIGTVKTVEQVNRNLTACDREEVEIFK